MTMKTLMIVLIAAGVAFAGCGKAEKAADKTAAK